MILLDEGIVERKRRIEMKKLMTLMLGLAFLSGSVVVATAQTPAEKSDTAKKPAPKKAKKDTAEKKADTAAKKPAPKKAKKDTAEKK
jgi:hypothetical protein